MKSPSERLPDDEDGSMHYSAADIEHILRAYSALFPKVDGGLSEYWDFGRKRPWSCLTTDFHCVTPEIIARFDKAVREEGHKPGNVVEVGGRLRDLSQVHGVGYSLGINPWTDDLLLRTFTPQTKRVIIILGHDWYPIITADLSYRATPPLDRFSVFDEPKYGEAIPASLWADGETAVLFLNLYPDFRAPGMDVMGSLGDYGPLLRGFEALCSAVDENYEIKAILSWGSTVWEALNRKLDRQWRALGVMAAVTRQLEQGCPHQLPLGARSFPYYAFAHPSFTPNFKRPNHLKAYSTALDRLTGAAGTLV